jgi:GTP-binding protein
MFIDEVEITVKSGKGGPGCVSFLREKFIVKGGPDGGDGGDGGSLIVRADTSTNTLVDLHYERFHFAENGHAGGSKNCTGKRGQPKILVVPVGTQVFNAETDELLVDLTEVEQEFQVAKGGRGGQGNAKFSSSRNRAPRKAQPGEPGTEVKLRLELKLLADVGLIGMPNVGKSTLISRISKARPKIADYPFTTLIPNLGVVSVSMGQAFVVADVPGLIPGAAQGAGLGVQFLKHVERTRVLVHLLDAASGRDPYGDWEAIRAELGAFNPALLDRPEIIALSRVDASQEADAQEAALRKSFGRKRKVMRISAVTGEGVSDLVRAIWKLLEKDREKDL